MSLLEIIGALQSCSLRAYSNWYAGWVCQTSCHIVVVIVSFLSMQHPEPVLLDSRCGGLCNRQLVLDKTFFTPKKAALAKARKTAESATVTSIFSQALSSGISAEDLAETFVAKKRKAALAALSVRCKKHALTKPLQSAAIPFDAQPTATSSLIVERPNPSVLPTQSPISSPEIPPPYNNPMLSISTRSKSGIPFPTPAASRASSRDDEDLLAVKRAPHPVTQSRCFLALHNRSHGDALTVSAHQKCVNRSADGLLQMVDVNSEVAEHLNAGTHAVFLADFADCDSRCLRLQSNVGGMLRLACLGLAITYCSNAL